MTRKPRATATAAALAFIAPDLRALAVPIGQLKTDPHNARLHNDRNLGDIRASLAAHGQRKPVVARPDGTVIAGSGTLEAALRLGWTHLARVVYEGTEEQARAFALQDNRSAESATWDYEILRGQVLELESAGFEVEALGWTPAASGGTGSDPGGGRYQEQFGVIVVCADEAEQQRVYEQLRGLGLTCKVVVA